MAEIKDSINEIDDIVSFWANYGVTVVPIPIITEVAIAMGAT